MESHRLRRDLKWTYTRTPPEIHRPHLQTDFCLLTGTKILVKKALEGSNFVFSPLSLHLILTLLAAGYKGATLNEILTFLGYDSIDDVNMAAKRLMGLLSSSESREILLSFVNGAWIDERLPFNPRFEEIVNGVYNAQIKRVNFFSQFEAVRVEVNSWAENETKGLIKEILPQNSLDPSTAAVFANALYFNGAWDGEFDVRTRKKDFHLLDGNVVQVPFMTRGGRQWYGDFNGYKVVKIPYQRGDNTRQFAMYFLLPDDKDGLSKLVEMTNSRPKFFYQEFQLSPELLDEFWIPKFKFSFGFEATKTMKQIGHELPFKVMGDLTETVVSHCSPLLYVPYIFHKSFIEVNEQGTEAAAVTAAVMRLGCAPPRLDRPKPRFVADHSFIFVLREETSKVVFFIGAVLNPSCSN